MRTIATNTAAVNTLTFKPKQLQPDVHIMANVTLKFGSNRQRIVKKFQTAQVAQSSDRILRPIATLITCFAEFGWRQAGHTNRTRTPYCPCTKRTALCLSNQVSECCIRVYVRSSPGKLCTLSARQAFAASWKTSGKNLQNESANIIVRQF